MGYWSSALVMRSCALVILWILNIVAVWLIGRWMIRTVPANISIWRSRQANPTQKSDALVSSFTAVYFPLLMLNQELDWPHVLTIPLNVLFILFYHYSDFYGSSNFFGSNATSRPKNGLVGGALTALTIVFIIVYITGTMLTWPGVIMIPLFILFGCGYVVIARCSK